ncbi:hypothetical protein [Priestia endophytica]|nr:hypothetical protein [Priestia endophytica]
MTSKILEIKGVPKAMPKAMRFYSIRLP